MLQKILLAVGALVAVFVVVVSMQPGEMNVSRSASVAGSQALVFDLADDFTSWERWNPWRELDPNQVTTLEGPATGVGAATSWKGNKDVGSGRMEITAVTPPSSVVWDLHFKEPFESRAVVTLTVEPEGEGSKVTWSMVSPNNFMAKMAGLFMDMDAMVGKDFERGLGYLDREAKAETARVAAELAATQAAAEAAAAEAAAAALAAGGTVLEGAAAPAQPAVQ